MNSWNHVTLLGGHFLIKIQTVWQVLVTLCHIYMVWGCCVMIFGWLIWVQGTKNWWFHLCCDDVHCCHQFSMLPVDVLFGDISMYPHDTKIWPMSCHKLSLPSWHNIGRICIGLKLEEDIWIQHGGSIKYSVLFSDLTHCAQWLFGDECTFAESMSTCDFVP